MRRSSIDVLANDTDVDNGAVLTVTAASGARRPGHRQRRSPTRSVRPGHRLRRPRTSATARSWRQVHIEDEHGATSARPSTITVTGTNDGPVANADTDTTGENAAILVDVLANDTDVDNGAVLTVTAARRRRPGQRPASVANQVQFDPGTDFDHLAAATARSSSSDYTDRGRAWRDFQLDRHHHRHRHQRWPGRQRRHGDRPARTRRSWSTCWPTTPTSTTARC